MKPAAAFAVGLWTGALVMAGVGGVYWRVRDGGRVEPVPPALETRLQLLQQEQAKAAAEAQRLRQTVAELRTTVPIPPATVRASRSLRVRENGGVPGIDAWIIDSVQVADTAALARLEQAATENNLPALDALALLADRDHAEALTRVWATPGLKAATKERATLLLAATVETNPRGAELLQSLAGNAALVTAAVTGLGTPDFTSRLVRTPGIKPPPHFKPDYALRLRIAENLRQVVTDETVGSSLEQLQSNLRQRTAGVETPAP